MRVYQLRVYQKILWLSPACMLKVVLLYKWKGQGMVINSIYTALLTMHAVSKQLYVNKNVQ